MASLRFVLSGRMLKQREASTRGFSSYYDAYTSYVKRAPSSKFCWISERCGSKSRPHSRPNLFMETTTTTEITRPIFFRQRLDLAFANLVLRLWVALRFIMAGVDKFRGGDGVNATLNAANFEVKSGGIARQMGENSLLPAIGFSQGMIEAYAHSLGYLLPIVGAWVLIGLFSEFALVAAGLTFISLGFGLAALPDDMEVTANIGVGILIVSLALITNRHGFLSLDGLFGRGRKRPVGTLGE
jgi:thiosulfate dehydrogenase [quinone] large subunit